MSEVSARDLTGVPAESPERALARLSFPFLLDQATIRVGDLSTTDALLVLAINQANIAPLTREPLARLRYGRLDAPAPDSRRRPVSMSAVASSLRLPFETVRRHLRRLEAGGVCMAVEGGVIVPEAFLASPAYLASASAAHARLRAFYYEAAAAGLVEPLPRSAYPAEEATPVRGAVRLLSDYLLRSGDSLMAAAGDVVSMLVLVGIVNEASPAASVATLSQRLRMPAETVRRHALRLAERGQCERSGRGFTVPPSILASPDWAAVFRDNAINVQRLFAGLAERGVIEAWARLGLGAGAEGATMARSSRPGM